MELSTTAAPIQVRELVQEVRRHMREHGIAPTERELAIALGYKARRSIGRYLAQARQLGLLEHRPGHNRCNIPPAAPGACRACGHPLDGAG